MKKYESDDFARKLSDSITASRRAMEPFLRFRKEVMREVCGSNYSQSFDSLQPIFINKLEQAVSTFSRLLTARQPRVKVKTSDFDLRPIARSFQESISKDLQELRFRDTMQNVVTDALALFGISKVGLNHSELELEIEGVTYDPMAPFFQRVSPDNWVMDMSARDWDSCQYMGDLVRRDWEWMKESGLYKNLDQISPDSAGDGAVDHHENRAEYLSRSNGIEQNVIFDRCSFYEIYIPRDHVIISIPRTGGKILRVQEWDGPEFGPYEMLSFMSVPDNLVPLSPSMNWMDAHKLIKVLMLKFSQQAKDQKTILAVMKRAAQDGKKIQMAKNGQIILTDVKGGVEEVSLAGVDQKNWAFLLWLIQQFNMAAGNLEILGGLAPQSGTVGQDQMLSQNAGVRVDDMRGQVVEFSTRNIEKLGWYHYTDPIRDRKISKRFPDLPFEIPGLFTPEMREADFRDFGFEIAPYSMLPRSPSQDRQELMETMQQVVIPFAPLFQQQGINVDAAGIIELLGEYGNLKELDRVFSMQPVAGPGMEGMEQAGGAPQGGGMPAHTVRENVRTNVSATNQRGLDQLLMMQLMGGQEGLGPASKLAQVG